MEEGIGRLADPALMEKSRQTDSRIGPISIISRIPYRNGLQMAVPLWQP
jgi:hypothetical protein